MFQPAPHRFQPGLPLSEHPVHKMPPTGAPYIWGRWHKSRVSLEGYRREAVSLAKAALGRGHGQPTRFLIFGRPRSGSTLLTRLLNQVPEITCGGEMLNKAMFAPHAYLNRMARLSGAGAHGSKYLSYQMLEIQKPRDPRRFFAGLVADGFQIIHLKRNTFEQSLSLSLAQATGRYHRKPGEPAVERPTQVRLDPDAFLRQYTWNASMLDYEHCLLAGLPHLSVIYETDLQNAGAHSATVAGICSALGVAPGAVKADMRRIGGPKGVMRATNVDELRDKVRELLPLQMAG